MKKNEVLRSNIRASVRNFARFNQWDSSSIDKCVDAIIEHFELQLPTEEEIKEASNAYNRRAYAGHIDGDEPLLHWMSGVEWLLSKLKEQ
jgi:hypothetical protein